MTEWYGWMGNNLRVDLSKGKATKEPLTEDLVYNFVGGRGLSAKILYDETGPETDPLGPDNRFIIGTGPTSCTMPLGGGRYTLTTKSPLTGILGDGSGGGTLAAEVKFAGYDHIIVQGRAQKPVYIWINDDQVEIKDAQHLWGKDIWETEALIRQELGDRDIQTLTIGPAGENLVKYACPVPPDERVAGQCGMGAVMGSKNLKAIAIRGSQSVKVANRKKFEEIIRSWYEDMPKGPLSATHHDYGSPYLIGTFNQIHVCPIKNGQELHAPDEVIGHMYVPNWLPKYMVRHISCFGCPHACQKFMEITDGPFAGERGSRPEFAFASVTTLLGVFDVGFGLLATNLANKWGMDLMELGHSMSMAFECYQRGILTRKDTGGLRLEWGNKEVILELIRQIAYREGFGALLADGTLNAARKIGKGAEKYVHEVKGKSHPDRITSYIPTVIGFAFSTRGFCHLRASVFPHVKPEPGPPKFWDYDPRYAKWCTDREHSNTAADCLEICKFLTDFEIMEPGKGGVARMAELLSALSGLDFSEERLHEVCDRVYNIERAYLTKHGIRRKDDRPPLNFIHDPLPSGPSAGMTFDMEKFEVIRDAWYDLRGSDRKTGAPRRDTLEKLGLKYVADDLEKTGVYQEGK
jgi:aldehyde:ferredoxin oxidoreductase